MKNNIYTAEAEGICLACEGGSEEQELERSKVDLGAAGVILQGSYSEKTGGLLLTDSLSNVLKIQSLAPRTEGEVQLFKALGKRARGKGITLKYCKGHNRLRINMLADARAGERVTKVQEGKVRIGAGDIKSAMRTERRENEMNLLEGLAQKGGQAEKYMEHLETEVTGGCGGAGRERKRIVNLTRAAAKCEPNRIIIKHSWREEWKMRKATQEKKETK